tara:strand:+ start:1913 stop:2212 length:300 start_codon:yes stop_codon:yes gene_type:complete
MKKGVNKMNKKEQLERISREKQAFKTLNNLVGSDIKKSIDENKNPKKSFYLHLYHMICSNVNGERIKTSIARDIILKNGGNPSITNQSYQIYMSLKGGY